MYIDVKIIKCWQSKLSSLLKVNLHGQVGPYSRMQEEFNIRLSINIIPHIKRPEAKK